MVLSKNQEDIVNALLGQLKECQFPNLLVHGPPGCGKKSIVKEALRRLVPQETDYDEHVYTLNCGRCIGITHVRDQIKLFAKSVVKSKPLGGFKVVVLYNAALLTKDAQAALRRCIEDYNSSTRFVFIVENEYDIILPLQSRCVNLYCGGINKNGALNYYDPNINELIDCKKTKTWFKRNIPDLEKVDVPSFINFSIKAFSCGYSSLDLLNYLVKKKRVSSLNAYSIIDTTKCERLAMFIVLCIYCDNNNN